MLLLLIIGLTMFNCFWKPSHKAPNVPTLETETMYARALSTNQETAQLLSGASMPTAVINSLLNVADVGKVLGILNLSPYDGWLERVALKWTPRAERDIRTLSVSTNVNYTAFSEKQCAFILMEDSELEKQQ